MSESVPLVVTLKKYSIRKSNLANTLKISLKDLFDESKSK